jgi:hypothetical protein
LSSGKAKESNENRTKIALLWDYSVYHSRWSELTENDFEPSSSYEKGAESRIKVTRNELTRIDAGRKIDGGTTGERYLRKIIEDCQNRGIDVLLTYLPFPATESEQMGANYVRDLADEYDVNYINFLDLDLIDYQTDLYDENSHLNPSGARKVTDYLGKYLLEHYDITDQRNNEAYSGWHTDYEEYNELKNSNLAKQTDIVTYLMLLSNDNIDAAIDVKNKDIFQNTWIIDLLENLGVDVNLLNEDTDFIIIKNGGEGTIVLDDFKSNGISTDTEIGNIMLDYQESSNEYSLYVNGIEYINGSIEDDTSMQICVLRNKTVIDNVKFVYTIDQDTKDVEISDVYR